MKQTYRKILRDNFHSINRTFIARETRIKYNPEEHYKLCQYLEKHITDEFKSILINCIKSSNISQLESYVESNKIDLSNKFQRITTHRIVTEMTQFDIESYKIQPIIVEYFQSVLPFLVKKYVKEYEQEKINFANKIENQTMSNVH